MSNPSKRPEVVAIYCPLWHTYDHACSWKGEGWCEWELLKSAIPRFPGHPQPLEPEWGCFDESDPAWSSREIDLARDHGIDVFLFDWYWYSGVRIMEEALEKGFLRAGNRESVRFALMWANHHWSDYFPAPFGKDWNSWLPSRHSKQDLFRVVDYAIEHYFCHSNYWRVDGRLFFSLFDPCRLVDELGGPGTAEGVFREVDCRLAQAGLPGLHLNAMLWDPGPVERLRQAGFMSTTNYNVNSSGKVSANLTETYEDLMEAHRIQWDRMSGASLPYLPVATMGWDVTPRCEKTIPFPFPQDPRSKTHSYPYGPVVLGNTPELFGQLCREARAQVSVAGPSPQAVFVNAWNEWTEGCYLLPEKRYGLGYLRALKEAFA